MECVLNWFRFQTLYFEKYEKKFLTENYFTAMIFEI